MSRKKVEINKLTLQETIQRLEKEKTFTNRQELYAELALVFKTSSTTINNRIKSFNLLDVITTPLGKKGNKLLAAPKHMGPRKNKYDSPEGKRHIKAIKRITAVSMHPTIDRAAKGSLKAAIKMKCWDCSGEQKGEIKNCTVIDCALWPVRPYRNAS